MPVDDAFERQDIAVLYDSFNGPGADWDFYFRMAARPCHVLDLGCGTGSIALRLAALGHSVTGLDPAAGMLSVARTSANPHGVEWIEGDARNFSLDRRFDLIIMTGHVFQVFLEDSEMLAVLTCARRHLANGGRLVFESRNPLKRTWEQWTEAASRQTADVPGIGEVEAYYQVTRTWDEFVRFDAVFTLSSTGERRVSTSALRFADRDTIGRLLAEAGFSDIEWIGDWDGSPFSDDSPEIIAVAIT